MVFSVDNWLLFLRDAKSAAAFPLVVGGLVLMLFGWRMWKLCVVLSFGAIGAGIGVVLAGARDDQWLFALVGGAVVGLAGYWLARFAVAVLGGLIGFGIVASYLSNLGLHGPTLWCAAGTGLITCTAFAFLNRRNVVIIVTAFLGAALLVSGLTALAMSSPILFGAYASMAGESAIVVPFLLLVPTVMSCFYQMAEVRRLHMDT